MQIVATWGFLRVVYPSCQFHPKAVLTTRMEIPSAMTSREGVKDRVIVVSVCYNKQQTLATTS